jgi:hypothetical protein
VERQWCCFSRQQYYTKFEDTVADDIKDIKGRKKDAKTFKQYYFYKIIFFKHFDFNIYFMFNNLGSKSKIFVELI